MASGFGSEAAVVGGMEVYFLWGLAVVCSVGGYGSGSSLARGSGVQHQLSLAQQRLLVAMAWVFFGAGP